jgi:hypothetical protein
MTPRRAAWDWPVIHVHFRVSPPSPEMLGSLLMCWFHFWPGERSDPVSSGSRPGLKGRALSDPDRERDRKGAHCN